MLHQLHQVFFSYLDFCDDILWSYAAVPAILIFGGYLSYKAKWFQVQKFPTIWKQFFKLMHVDGKKHRGVHPLQAFFAAVGGCIGIGNIVSVATAVQIGGPGAIFWMWIAALFGMVVKYAEIYLGIHYRVKNKENSYNGGPMYYLKNIDPSGWLSIVFCLLMCVYGVEVYMFRIITHSITTTWGWNPTFVIAFLLVAVLLAGKQGVKTIGKVSSFLIPLFLTLFIGVSMWVFINDIPGVINAFGLIFKSAFSGHAALGAFTGSSLMLTISSGMKRACYTGDIGIGYSSIIHAESTEPNPCKQASLGIFGIFLDTFIICTMSVLLIVVTGLWNQGIHEDYVVAQALSTYIPYIDYLWPLFVFLLGYSSLIAFYTVGKKAAQFVSPRYGAMGYTLYAIVAFIFFSFFGTESHILTVMSLTGGLLLLINMYAIIYLYKKLRYTL